ncbi:MAG: hypothetical protein JWN14_1836 [Chthonomonadales bacterium]|nr:hypothetical protein [Chthonomonadales bacterium]
MTQLNVLLAALFEAHGIDTVLNGKWILFPGTSCRACASIGQEIPNAAGITIQLDVRFEIVFGRFIVESCAGMGETWEEAVEEALRNFASYSLHVLIAAFLNGEDADALEEEWVIGGRARCVLIGNVVLRGRPPGEREEVLTWYEGLQQRIEALDLGPEAHWVRVYYAQAGSKSLACEALLDNAVWVAMKSQLAAFAWPRHDAFYAVRQFLVIAGEDKEEITAESAVAHLAETLAANPDLTEDEAYEALTDAAVSASLADRVYKFTQIAWGRLLLGTDGIAFSNEYVGLDAEGNIRENGKLNEEPCFNAASHIDPRYISLPACQRLALASAEVAAVNNALNAGAKLENLVMAPVFLFCESPTPAGLQNAQRVIAQHVASLQAQHTPAPASSESPSKSSTKPPKWQFWKR